MAQDKKTHFPSGLPARFANGKEGFKRLCDFLRIQNRKQRQALRAAVKPRVQHKNVSGLSDADRQRELITAFYEAPDERCTVWRFTVAPSREVSDALELPVPSLEERALERYDAQYREREVDEARLEDALGEFPDAAECIADAPEWRRPALAVWPDLHRDVTGWTELPADRRDAVALALFAVSTILDEVRILRWAADRVESLGEEFAPVLKSQGGEPQTTVEHEDDDVIRKWKETCDAIAATARILGADPPQPQYLQDLARLVVELNALHGPLVRIVEMAVPEKLLQKLDQTLLDLVNKHGESPIVKFVGQIGAQWRLAYPIGGELDAAALRADVERAVRESQHALEDWQKSRGRKADLQAQLEVVRQEQSSARDPRDRFSAEDREGELQEQIAVAHKEIRVARDHIFSVVAPAGERFDPAEDYEARSIDSPPQGMDGQSDGASDGEAAENEDAVVDAPTEADDAPGGSEAIRDGRETGETHPEKSEGPIPAEPGNRRVAGSNSTGDDETGKSSAKSPEAEAEDPQAGSEADGPRHDSATMALWRTLGGGRSGIAYHIARLLAEQGRSGPLAPPPDIIAASMLAPHVRSADSEVVAAIRPIMVGIDPGKLFRSDWEDDARDAVSLLLFSAALRPALLAPSTAAPSLLRRIRVSEGLESVYRLAAVVADHADRLQGVRLDASLLQATLSGTWRQEFESFVTRVQDWRTRADSKRNLYGRADRVWRDLLDSGGCLSELTELMSGDERADGDRVEVIRKQIGNRRAFEDLVRRMDRDRNRHRSDPIQGRALKQIWNDVQPAVTLSSEWLRLMDAKPKSTGFIDRRIDALGKEIVTYGANALAALDRARSGDTARARVAALKHARHAVDDVLCLFHSTTGTRASDLYPNAILSRDLLFITDLDLDSRFRPVQKDGFDLLDLLLNTDAHADAPRAAFATRLARNDLVGARLACDFVEAEGDSSADECRASLIQQIDVSRRELRAALSKEEERLERAFCRGQIDADERNDMAATLSSLRAVAISRSLTLPSLDEVDAMASAFPKLEEIGTKTKKSGATSIKQAKNRLRNVPADKLDDGARLVVEKAIDAGYILTAHEQIDRLERGETIAPPSLVDDPFQEFMNLVGEIEREREATDIAAIIRCAASRERATGVPFETLSEDAAKQAVHLLESWYRLARIKTRRVETNALQELLQCLGFKVRDTVTERTGRGWPLAEVTTEAIEDRTLCPSRQFGSEAAGRYRVLLNWDRPADESISRSIGSAGSVPTVVLHFGCLGVDREKLRAQAVQTHRLFLVVDESLILFLAGRSAQRLSALFRCTLPFSSAQPYATTSGLVPSELFYGRERERQAVMDQSGACFIYGGRQLGKTALLRRVERDFNRSRETHVAKWIDLKANEIGYARAAHDIWRCLQLELRRLGVHDMRRELDPENKTQVGKFLGRIRQWLDERTDRRLILLLDEADQFLVQDAKTDFLESTRLKGLMDETERRFKVVFAGLHNVLRTTRQANHPLAHLGDPICVGAMLSNGEWKQAQALVREPLQAVGCRFDRDDLSTRILAQTNYYPSLIQLYGAELVHRLRDSTKPFPYEIGDDDIDGAYASRELRSAIRERFLLTLGLDQRYEVIAYALASELSGGNGLDRGLERVEIMEMARVWWSEGFELRDIEFDMLLHEMEGLGVLRAIERGRYTLRNPNILFLLGGREDIEEALNRERTLPPPFEPASFRARYPNDPPSSARRGPLTYQQETNFRNGGVALISGCNAAGLDEVDGFMSKRIGRDSFRKLAPSTDIVEFEQQLRALRPVRNSVTVYLVSQEAHWDVSWLSAAKRVLKNKAQGRKMWSRVAFIATPRDLWQLLTDAEESDLDGIDWIGPRPCDETFLRRWLQDTNLTANADNAGSLLEISGGWVAVLEAFSKKKAGRSWRTRIEELQRETLRDSAALLREGFGLSDEAEKVFRGLIEADDPFDHDSIELVSGDVGVSQEDVQRRVIWGERLGLLSTVGPSRWKLNPLVRRLLEASAPV